MEAARRSAAQHSSARRTRQSLSSPASALALARQQKTPARAPTSHRQHEGRGENGEAIDLDLATGANTRQVQAIADAVQEALRVRGLRPALVEGYAQGEWVLLDYFDFIVHVFVPAKREFYALERLWGDAEKIEISA